MSSNASRPHPKGKVYAAEIVRRERFAPVNSVECVPGYGASFRAIRGYPVTLVGFDNSAVIVGVRGGTRMRGIGSCAKKIYDSSYRMGRRCRSASQHGRLVTTSTMCALDEGGGKCRRSQGIASASLFNMFTINVWAGKLGCKYGRHTQSHTTARS